MVVAAAQVLEVLLQTAVQVVVEVVVEVVDHQTLVLLDQAYNLVNQDLVDQTAMVIEAVLIQTYLHILALAAAALAV